jgi:hypothetical protein
MPASQHARQKSSNEKTSVFQKFLLTPPPNHRYISPTPFLSEGRIMIVTNVGRVAVDADVPKTNGADAYGEGVWS